MERFLITKFALILAVIYMTGALAQENSIRLIIRGDDLGCTQGSIEAFEQAIIKGVLTCASIQVPADE